MLAKFYVFMHEFFPQGFVGKFKHIRGGEIMQFLLCHPNACSVSRHKATKYTEETWQELRKWMKRGRNWKEASKEAKTIYDQGKLIGKKAEWKAPGLHSPAGLLALLIIAYPEHIKYKEQISALGIEWMIADREKLDVQQTGYWKSLDNENLDGVFQPEEPRKALVDYLADYDRLFGEDFIRCKEDIRPFLQDQAWVQPWVIGHIIRETPFNENQDDSEQQEEGRDPPSSESHCPDSNDQTTAKARELYNHLYPATTRSTTALKEWLAGKASHKGSIFVAWSRSLIIQSVRRLNSLSNAPAWAKTADAYMLLDMRDNQLSGLQTQGCDMQIEDRQHELMKSPRYAEYVRTTDQFAQLVKGDISEMADGIARCISLQHANFFHMLLFGIGRYTDFNQYVMDVISLTRLRTAALIQNIRDRPNQQADSRHRKPFLLGYSVGTALKLTDWQLQALLDVHANDESILTDWQLHIYQKKFQQSTQLDDISQRPLIIVPDANEGSDNTIDDAKHYLLAILSLQNPSVDPRCLAPSSKTIDIPATQKTVIPHQTLPLQLTPTPTQNGQPSQTPQVVPGALPQAAPIHTTSSSTVASFGSIEQGGNPYAGKKRGPSLSDNPDTRLANRPRLLTREDLTEELAAYKNKRDTETKQEAERRKQEAESLTKELSALREEFHVVGTELAEVKQAQIGIATEARVREIVRDEIISLKEAQQDDRRALDERLVGMQDSLKACISSLEELHSKLDEWKASISKPPSLGDEGYLTQYCHTSRNNQKEYESRLTQAALFYMRLYREPDGLELFDCNPLTMFGSAGDESYPPAVKLTPETYTVPAHRSTANTKTKTKNRNSIEDGTHDGTCEGTRKDGINGSR
ncbi:hypothetical protein F4803DRAFT_574345 [Xylaria telfairii]|nr:hypothetical protein F4803DRAFT_574345 [Xylaria telfairii]